MRPFRAFAGLAVAVLSAGLADQAAAQIPQPQATQAMPPELTAALGDWAVCRGRVVAERASGPESPDAIADEAMKRCEPEQAKSRALAVKAFGRGGAVLVERAALTGRSEVIDLVNDKRSGAKSDDPIFAWGTCLNSQASQGAAGRAEAAAIVQQAYAACRDQEQRMRASLEAQVGHDQAATLLVQLRALFHDQAPKLIAQIRRGR